MKKNAIKNAMRVLVALATITVTTVFTSCSEAWFNPTELPKPTTEYIEVPIEVNRPYWINDSLYVGTSATSSWLIAADVNISDPALLKAVAEQGKPSFKDDLKEVATEGNITNFSYTAKGSDDQILTGYVKVRQDALVGVSNITLSIKKIDATEIKIGQARGMKITVINELKADVTIDGKTETVRHNLKNVYIQCEEVVRIETVEKIITEYVEIRDTVINTITRVDTLIQVDSITVYIYEQIEKIDTVIVVEPQYFEVHDTTIVNIYNYLKGERIETKDRIGYSVATVKVGNENILSATLNLAQRIVTVPEEKLNTATLTNYTEAGCSVDDGQSGVLTINANGCTVNRIAWADPVLFEADSYGTLFDVACVLYCSRINEIGEVIDFEVEMIPSYYHVAATPEPQVVTYSVSFVNSEVANNKMQGTFYVSGSDGFADEYSMPVAVYGLPLGLDTLYVKNMTVEKHTFVQTPSEGTLKNKKGWMWCYDQLITTVGTDFRTINDGLVGPNNRLTYKVAHVERELPNGENVVWKMVAETVVDDDQYVNDSSKSNHYCVEEQHEARYEQTLLQHVSHYISGTVTIGNGEPMEVIFTGLQKVGNKYLIDEGTAVTNIYSTGD